jgi:pimeloyl-ACP methyl ester carboxylesterase
MNDQLTQDPQTILDRIQSQATRYETPCGDGRMIWHMWDQSGGAAPVVVLFHGGAGSWRHWIHNIPALVPTYRVLVPDLPGLGESDFPPSEVPEEIAVIVSDGIDSIVGADTRYDLVGFSFGSTMAVCVGALRGAHLRSVTVIGCSGVTTSGTAVNLKKVRHLEGPERKETHRYNLNQLMIADAARIDDLALVMQDWNTVRSRLHTPPISRSGVVLRALEKVTAPINAIWGELDAPANPRGVERAAVLRELKPEADIRLIPGGGHWIAYERPDIVNAYLLEMLARTRP